MFGTNPLSMAYFGAMVDNQIPVLIPLVIISIVTSIRFGIVGLISFLMTALIFALFRSFLNGKDNVLANVSKFLASMIITKILMVLLNVIEVKALISAVFEIMVSVVFYLVFREGLKLIINNFKKESLEETNSKIKSKIILKDCLEQTVFCALLLVMAFSGFNVPIVLEISIFSLVSILAVMIICCNKPVFSAMIISLFIAIGFMLINGFGWQIILLYIIAGAVTALLSRAKKIGLIVGLVFSILYSVVFSINQNNMYSEYGMNPRLLKDYANFVEKYENNKSSGEDEVIDESGEVNTFNNLEAIQSLKDSSKPSSAAIVLREMAIGFLILLLMPDSFFKHDVEDSKFTQFIKKIFPNKDILALEPGKPKPKAEAPVKKKKSKTKKK